MTRYTNFGRKRTYVQAGFDNDPQPQSAPEKTVSAVQDAGTSGEGASEPEKKKRKRIRGKKPKVDGEGADAGVSRGGQDGEGGQSSQNGRRSHDRPNKGKKFQPKGP